MKSVDLDRVSKLSNLIRQAEQPVRILSGVAWEARVKVDFFERGAKELPRPTYPAYNPGPTERALKEVLSQLTDHPIDRWLGSIAEKVRLGSQLLVHRGRREFFDHSVLLYGEPTSKLQDNRSDSLALAQLLSETLDQMVHDEFLVPAEACILVDQVKKDMERAVKSMLGDAAPTIEVVDELSANAVASSKSIKLRRGACFSEKDIAQLIHHEAGIHVTTYVNGTLQTSLPILGASHPGVTRTQEGLAVFAEFITGSIDISRMRRLADRVLAIQMAKDGADFLDVYGYFLERVNGKEEDAFEHTRRVFRGSPLSGGAPFTKDVVYLDGLLRVHNFLRTAISAGRVDCLKLLFCGKIDIEDVPILCELAALGLVAAPKHLPKWVAEPGFLVTYLAYSGFLNKIRLGRVKLHYRQMLEKAPVCHFKTVP